ncbi:hypothetical protein [Flavobacterium piscinae]|nr:hypothetical protein [Flavobacterium piscinae]
MTDDEKVIIEILKTSNNIGLSELKEKTALSGKKWDVCDERFS